VAPVNRNPHPPAAKAVMFGRQEDHTGEAEEKAGEHYDGDHGLVPLPVNKIKIWGGGWSSPRVVRNFLVTISFDSYLYFPATRNKSVKVLILPRGKYLLG
jgi:hypothetical protein